MGENIEDEYEKIDQDHVNFCRGFRHIIQESQGNLTQKGVAEMAGVSQVNMSRVMNATHGTTHRWRTVVASSIGTSAKELINLGERLSGEKINEGGKLAAGNNENLVPLLSWEAARDWPVKPETNTMIRTVGDHGRNAFALTIKIDTMEPEFNAGETIIVDADIQPVSGMFVITKSTKKGEHGEAAIGQLMRNNTSTILAPINRRYPIEDLSGIPFEIIGVVVYKQKSYLEK